VVAGGTGATTSTGTGAVVLANTPTLITPVIGAATGTSLVTSNGIVTTGAFGGTFTTGVAIDYSSGLARISVDNGDDISFFAGGVGVTPVFRINDTGAIGVGAGTLSFGTLGQALVSNGPTSAPSWSSLPSATYTRTSFSATGGQTTFSLTYVPGFVEVFVNGVLLNAADYTDSNGTTIVLATACAAGDVVEAVAYNATLITTSTTAANIAGGIASQIPYQVGPGSTAFIPNGTSGQALISAGTSVPAWGTLAVSGGGTGLTTLTAANNALYSTSSSALTAGTLPVAAGGTGITSFGTGVATFLGTPSSANLASAVTDETGSGALVFATSPTLVTPVLGTPTSGTLSNCTVDGTNQVGFRNIPQVSQSSAYTLVLADSGDHIFHPSADTTARTWTIPANSSVAFPIGTAVTFINQNGAGVITIAITSDTMRLSPAGTTGSRTLAANGVATAIKITATEWIISGVGLT
jgi:hypothetical protein